MEHAFAKKIKSQFTCLLCFKGCVGPLSQSLCTDGSASGDNVINEDSEIFALKTVLGYLKVKIPEFADLSSTLLESIEGDQHEQCMCQDCGLVTDKFYRLYKDYQLIQREMDKCLHSLYDIMTSADKSQHGHSASGQEDYRKGLRVPKPHHAYSSDGSFNLDMVKVEQSVVHPKVFETAGVSGCQISNAYSILPSPRSEAETEVIDSSSSPFQYTIRSPPTPPVLPSAAIKRLNPFYTSDEHAPEVSKKRICSGGSYTDRDDSGTINVDDDDKGGGHYSGRLASTFTPSSSHLSLLATTSRSNMQSVIIPVPSAQPPPPPPVPIIQSKTRSRENSQSSSSSTKCNLCRTTFNFCFRVDVHYYNVVCDTGEECYKCVYCEKLYAEFCNFSTHLLSTHTMKLFAPFLPPGYTEHELEKVIQCVVKEHKPNCANSYVCLYCERKFRMPYSLRLHILECHIDKVVMKL